MIIPRCYTITFLQHDFIIDRLPSKYLSEHFTNILPLPPGDYSFNSIWYSRNIERATISIYYTVS